MKYQYYCDDKVTLSAKDGGCMDKIMLSGTTFVGLHQLSHRVSTLVYLILLKLVSYLKDFIIFLLDNLSKISL